MTRAHLATALMAVSLSLSCVESRPGESRTATRVDPATPSDAGSPPLSRTGGPASGTPNPCDDSHFDAASNVFLTRVAPDGTPCMTACIPAGQCVAGTCTGVEATCDDGNPCTEDACNGQRGCIHIPVTCAASSKPCKASLCDPAVGGCAERDVPDGTSCSQSDCAADVCISGACVARPLQEGASCGAPSPCQPAGRCEDQLCVRDAVEPLTPAWRYTAPDGFTVEFTGTADPAGNVYFTLASALGARPFERWVVSLDPGGRERFKTQLAGPDDRPATVRMLTRDEVIVDAFPNLWAVRQADGAIQWTLPTEGANSILEASDGDLLLLDGCRRFAEACGGGTHCACLLRIDRATGALKHLRRVGSYTAGHAVIDAADKVHTVVFRETEGWLVTLNPDGSDSAATRIGDLGYHTSLVATEGSQLLASYYSGSYYGPGDAVMLATHGHDARLQLPVQPFTPHEVLLSAGSGYLAGAARSGGEVLVRFDRGTGAEHWRLSLPSMLHSAPILSAQSTLVFEQDASLWDVSTDGQVNFQCPLQEPFVTRSSAHVLDNGRLIGPGNDGRSVLAYPVLDRTVANQGWVTPRGNPQRSARPR